MLKTFSILVFTLIIFCSQSDAQGLTDGPKIEGPWLWVTAPTNLNDAWLGGADAAISGIHFLSRKSGKAVTEQKIAAEGAIISESVGNKVWTLGSLPPTRSDNINEMLIAIGLADSDINTLLPMGLFLSTHPQNKIH